MKPNRNRCSNVLHQIIQSRERLEDEVSDRETMILKDQFHFSILEQQSLRHCNKMLNNEEEYLRTQRFHRHLVIVVQQRNNSQSLSIQRSIQTNSDRSFRTKIHHKQSYRQFQKLFQIRFVR